MDTTYEVYQRLTERGVPLEDLAYWVFTFRIVHQPDVSFHDCMNSVKVVLNHPTVQQVVLVGTELDELLEKKQLSKSVMHVLTKNIEIDHLLSSAIANEYGNVARSVYCLWDKKTEVIHGVHPNQINTFLDDVVGLLVGASCEELTKENNRRIRHAKEFDAKEFDTKESSNETR